MTDHPVVPHASKSLEDRMLKLGIREQDLEESFVRSGGHGGQNVNKVATCVVLVHRPSGTMVRCQEERSQALNRLLARRRLVDVMEGKALRAAALRRQEMEKVRRQKRKRSRRAKQIMLQDKRHRSRIKENRRPAQGE